MRNNEKENLLNLLIVLQFVTLWLIFLTSGVVFKIITLLLVVGNYLFYNYLENKKFCKSVFRVLLAIFMNGILVLAYIAQLLRAF